MASITEKIETLGSNFIYETAGLLASLTTTSRSLFLRLLLCQIINSYHLKRTFHCSKSNGSHTGYHYSGKFETLGSNFRHETPSVAAADPYYLRKVHFYKNHLQIITQWCMWCCREIHWQFLLMHYTIPSSRGVKSLMNHL